MKQRKTKGWRGWSVKKVLPTKSYDEQSQLIKEIGKWIRVERSVSQLYLVYLQ